MFLVSVSRAVGNTAHHLFVVVKNIPVFPLEFCSLFSVSQHPHLTSSVPPLYMASLPPGPVGQPSFFWLELEISACAQRHLLSGCSRTLSPVCCRGAHGGAVSQPAGCCPGTHILSLLSPHNPLRVVSNLQTGRFPKVYFAIS